MKVLVAVGCLLGLSACSAQQCDPSQAGFLSGIGCEASGSYAVRNQSQRSILAQQNAVALQNRVQAQNEGVHATQALVARDQARGRLAVIDQQNAQLRTRLEVARARGGLDQARLIKAEAELDALQRQSKALQVSATNEQLHAIEAQAERYRRYVDQVIGI